MSGYPTVTGMLRHAGGHVEEGALELPPDTMGGKNALQAIGSATSFSMLGGIAEAILSRLVARCPRYRSLSTAGTQKFCDVTAMLTGIECASVTPPSLAQAGPGSVS